MSWESYMKQAHERHNEVWNLAMKRQMDRRLFMKSSTIAALGGAAAVNGLLAACAGGEEQTIEEVLTEGYEYSRYPPSTSTTGRGWNGAARPTWTAR